MTNEEINAQVAENLEFCAELQAAKAVKAAERDRKIRAAAIAAAAAVEAVAASARKIGPSEIALDVPLVLGDLLGDSSKAAIVFDVIGYPVITLSRARLRKVAAELTRTKRRGPITCTLGGGLTFAWLTGHLTLRDQEPRTLPGIGCTSSIARLTCRHQHPLTPDNHLRVVIGGMQ